jgi:hypothetical protein
MSTILAIDFGKFKSVCCTLDTQSGEAAFRTVTTTPDVDDGEADAHNPTSLIPPRIVDTRNRG